MTVSLTIDREFRDLIPSSSDDELLILRESIKSEGCREPIIFWDNGDNKIIDGHQRHTICLQEKIKFATKGMKFADRAAAMQWMLRNQLSRRNLTEVQRKILRGRLYNSVKQDHGGERASGQNVHLKKTAESIAQAEGVDEKTVRRDGKLAEAVDQLAPPVARAIEQGEIPIKDAAALAELSKPQQKEVLKAVESGEAKNVTKAIEALEGKSDEPDELDILVDGGAHFDKLLNLCKQLKQGINETARHEQYGAWLSNKGAAGQACRDLDNVRNALRFAKPHSVCPYCKGKKCNACLQAGWVGESVAKTGKEALK